MKLNRRTKIFAIGAAGAVALGVGVGASVPTTASNGAAADPQLASLMSARSPGMREGAVTSTKAPRAQPVAFAAPPVPKSEVLSERTPAVKVASAAPVAAVLPPVAAPVAAVAPIPAPALAAAAPVLAIPAVPAAVGGVSPLLGGLALVPLVPAAFGGGGGGGVTAIDIAPAVPEPATWLMMITGFGMLGFALRRRRRQQRTTGTPAAGAVAVAQHG